MMTDTRSEARPAAVVFDCDGVLIESVDIKTAAFADLFCDYPEHGAAITEHHLAHLGISRFEKFSWIYRELLHRELSDADRVALGRRFSDLVTQGARSCPEVNGASGTLAALHDRAVPLFIASGTPQAELDGVIAARGWTRLFDGIYGSPAAKPEILAKIAHTVGSTPSQLVFVGDGWSDYEAAQATGATFVLRETAAQADRFLGYRGARIEDLEDFVTRLPELHGSEAGGSRF